MPFGARAMDQVRCVLPSAVGATITHRSTPASSVGSIAAAKRPSRRSSTKPSSFDGSRKRWPSMSVEPKVSLLLAGVSIFLLRR